MPAAEHSLMSMLNGGALLQASAMLLAFLVVLFIGSKLLPGRTVELAENGGTTRKFKLNGLALFVVTAIIFGTVHVLGWFSLSTLNTHFGALFLVANVLALGFTAWLYLRGRRTEDSTTGFWQGFVKGSQLNPVWSGIDLKFFSYRPSLIGLALLNVSFAVVQYETYGHLTLAMILYQAFTFLYVLNYFQFESGMIHTWDIVSERFGLMLVWGDYVLVPFFYCIGGWWLVHAESSIGPEAAVLLVILYVFGFWLFRGANQQKHRFRQDSTTKIWGRPAETLDGRLLVSGFWGIGRHLNYTGEICIYFAFILTIGFESWVPYLLPIWLTALLWHRSWRDDRRCRAKYGELWDRYVERVRFSMIPYVH